MLNRYQPAGLRPFDDSLTEQEKDDFVNETLIVFASVTVATVTGSLAVFAVAMSALNLSWGAYKAANSVFRFFNNDQTSHDLADDHEEDNRPRFC